MNFDDRSRFMFADDEGVRRQRKLAGTRRIRHLETHAARHDGDSTVWTLSEHNPAP
jgi:hypothetical protein